MPAQPYIKRTLRELLKLMAMDNIAEELDEHELSRIANQVRVDYDADLDSMQDWCEYTEMGLRLAEPAKGPRSEPWEDAANFKAPTLQESAYRFGERVLGAPKLLAVAGVDRGEPDPVLVPIELRTWCAMRSLARTNKV